MAMMLEGTLCVVKAEARRGIPSSRGRPDQTITLSNAMVQAN